MDAAGAIAVLEAGGLVILPADTVYGLFAPAQDRAAVARIDELKGRSGHPIALIGDSAAALVELIPELEGRWRDLLQSALPGPFTLVLPNPQRRLPWLSAGREGTIGVRIPEMPAESREVLAHFGPLAGTSANAHGESDPRLLEDIPESIREAAGAAIDGGELPGTPSTVIDLSGPEPLLLRAGAGDPDHIRSLL